MPNNDDAWPELEVTKLDAARRQLETSIWLLFEGRDAVSVRTLAHAAFGILKDVSNHRNERSVLDAANEIAASSPGFWNGFNRVGNFLKHADKDPTGVLSGVPEEENEALISIAIELYRNLGCIVTPEIESFYLWSRSIHFQSIDDVCEPFISWLNRNADRLHSDRRQELLDIGRELLVNLKDHGHDIGQRNCDG